MPLDPVAELRSSPGWRSQGSFHVTQVTRGMAAGLTMAAALAAGSAAAQTILEPGRVARGDLAAGDALLSDGSFYDCYLIRTRAGATYRVTYAAPTYDAYLAIGEGTSCAAGADMSDDDGGGGTDSALRFTGTGETWFVRANSLSAKQTGAYVLMVSLISETPPPAPAAAPAPWAGMTPTQTCTYTPGAGRIEMAMVKAWVVNHRMDGVIVRNDRELTREEAGLSYADGRPWYESGEALTIRGRRYEKYGLPRIVSPYELEYVAEHDTVYVGAEEGDTARDVVYILTSGLECAFQPYQAR